MRIILVLFIFFTFVGTASAAFGDAVFKGSYDFSGTASYDSSETDTGTGYALAIEYYKPIREIVHLGGGAEYQFSRTNEDRGEFYFIPLYGSLRVMIPIQIVKPYAIGRIGYNFFRSDSVFADDGSGGQADLKGGLTYGFGAGVIMFKYVLIEGQYSVNKGTLDYASREDESFSYSRFQISAGVNLGF
jgi:hypothetical protein